MSFKPIDDRQVVNRAILQELFPWIGSQTLDVLMASINADLTPPLKVDATSTPSLVVDVGPAIVTNPESNRNRSISFIDNLLPTFTGGTVTFPASSGGNIITSTGGSSPLTLPSGDYVQILLSLDQSGNLDTSIGIPNAILADAVVPGPTSNTLPFAYVTLFNNAGTIQNVTQSDIYQLVGGGGSGGSGGVAQEVGLSLGSISVTVVFPTPLSATTYVVIAQLVNKTDPDPDFQPITITNKTTTGFTATWNMPLDTANYLLDYVVGSAMVQIGEAVVSEGQTSVTITPSIPLAGTSYVVVAEFANYTDPDPDFQPITVTAKSASSFTLSWNMPLDTNNYLIAWHLAAYQ